ncbi:hypothetical protein AB7C87_13420 [Natrarchaeobius sp. A-rgal3]|uniref:hypothetical protein n=1 Tax=Natrarchaeobius versutus TaxID=1679078 RepID=UPI0035104982
MRRRMFLTAVGGVIVAGCAGSGSDAGGTEEEADTDEGTTESDEDGELEERSADERDDELVDWLVSELEDAGFDRVAVDRNDDGLELGYDATGAGEDDVAAEIELIADRYTTVVEDGLSAAWLEAIAYHPDDGEALDSFTIETEWVEAYLEESLEWRELLVRIGETFVSNQADDEGQGDDSTEGDGDEEDGDDEDGDNGDEQQEAGDDEGEQQGDDDGPDEGEDRDSEDGTDD